MDAQVKARYIVIPSAKRVGHYGIYHMTGLGAAREVFTSEVPGLLGIDICKRQLFSMTVDTN